MCSFGHCLRHVAYANVCYLQLCALYAVTDVALVTSLRDGMNLVSYEYVACQSENAGVGWPRVYTVVTYAKYAGVTDAVRV